MFGGFDEHLLGLSRCTVCRKGAAHIAPSAAAFVQLNIYLAFIDGENLADIAWDTHRGDGGFQIDDSKQFKKAKAVS